ncbi:unnamed protein product [Urochloa humidicola]
MAQPDAATARCKLEMMVMTMEPLMEGVERMILRHQKLPPAGTKRSQPEAPSRPQARPLSWLLTIDDKLAEINARAQRLYEDAMRDLDEAIADESAANADEHQEEAEG